MNDHSSTNTSKNQAVVIALAVLLAVSLSAVAALVVNRANSQQIGADTPTTIQVDVTSPQNSDEEPTAGEEIDLTSTENQTVEEAPVEEAPTEEAPAEEAPVEEAPVERPLLKRPLLKRPLLRRPLLRRPLLRRPLLRRPLLRRPLLRRPLLKRPLPKRILQLMDPTLTSISTSTLSCLALTVSFASNQVLCVPDIDIDFDFDFVLPCPDGFVRLESGSLCSRYRYRFRL